MIAMIGASLMLAHQVAGKAVRDSFFLSNFPASDLPKIVMASAVLSGLLALAVARCMNRFGPSVIVPVGFLVSSLLHLIEYFFMHNAPGQWAIVIYVHIVALSAILLSGFWSLMTEAFEPRTAKQAFGRITASGTLGSIAGGLLAERIAALYSAASVLLLLVALHLLCSISLAFIRRSALRLTASPKPDKMMSPFVLFKRAPYLLLIAMVVVVGTSSAAILDYLFKAGAGASLGKGAPLLRFFAVFYTASQIITFLSQTFLVRRALHKLGIGRAISMLPVSVGAGSLCGLLVPLFPTFAIIRSLESIMRGSLFRSGYELLYTPIPANEKRSAKTLIDVTFDRTGDALGSALVQLFLWIVPSLATSGLLGFALALSAIAILISRKLENAYSELVRKRLVDKAVELDVAEIYKTETRSIFVPKPAGADIPPAGKKSPVVPPRSTDATLDLLKELRSGESGRTLAAMKGIPQLTPVIAAQVARLLAWDEVSNAAIETLQKSPDPIAGLLIDHLTNPDVQFGVRRRIPRILRHCSSPLAVHGLLAGLADERFEVRFQCSRALDALLLGNPKLEVHPDAIFAAVERELRVAQPIWNSRRLIDTPNENDPNAFLDDILKERANKSLEHVFSLFATVLPREPIKIAFRVLHEDNKMLRGLAAEYLDSILPPNIRHLLWAMVDAGEKRENAGLSSQESLDRLLKSHESLMLMIDKTNT
jgi:hypothetical protein